MKLKQALVLTGIIMAMSAAQSASAFIFQPDGTAASAVNFESFDQTPGSALGINSLAAQQAFLAAEASVPGSGINAPGNQFTLAYQGNLGTTLDSNGIPTFTNGTGGRFFNFTMQFEEKFTGSSGVGPGNTSTFGFVNSGTNIFNLYANNVPGTNLTGANFGLGTAILTGYVESEPSSSFSNTTAIATRLDNFGANNWVGTQSVTGSGATDLNLAISFVNPAYFPDLTTAAAMNLLFNSSFNTSQVTPFNQADPSQAFNWINGGAHASNVGAINGGGVAPDFLFQADANQSFIAGVPEPELLLLLGIGFMGLCLSKRARG